MQQVHVGRIIKVRNTQQTFGLFHALLGQNRRMVLFIEQVAARGDLGLLVLMAALETRNDLISDKVFIRRLVRCSRDNERSTSFVNEDRVDLINDREVMVGLDQRLDIELHVVAKIVETELVISTVGDGAGVRVLSL